MTTYSHSNWICNVCMNTISKPEINKRFCKAFNLNDGIPPYANSTTIYAHNKFRPIQENDYVLEPLLKYRIRGRYKEYDDFKKLREPRIPPALGAYKCFDLELHTGISEPYLFYLIPNAWLEDIPKYAAPIKALLGDYNQNPGSQQIKELLESNEDTNVQKAFEIIAQNPEVAGYTLPNPLVFDTLRFAEAKDYYQMDFLQALITTEELNLDKSGIKELSPKIAFLKNLRYLYLSQNELNALPPEIGELRSLLRLDLYANQLSDLPQEISQLYYLQKLDLYHNHLNILPESICQLQNLKSLGLNHNQLTTLPDSVANLKKLEGLYCTDNLLTNFSQALCNSESIKYLYFSRNKIEEIPSEISNLKNLRWLGLAGNQLNILPESIRELPKLEWLDLRENLLSEAEQIRIREMLPYIEILF